MRPVLGLLAGLLCLMTAVTAMRSHAAVPAVAIDARISLEDETTRVVLVASRETEVASFLLPSPDRAVIELTDLHCRLASGAMPKAAGVVSAIRCGLFALGRSRLVVELNAPALVSAIRWEEGPVPGVMHLVAEFTKTDRATFRKQARNAAPEPETTGSIGAAPARRRPLVAIDPGHGGADAGAIATTGTFEKDVVLAFGRALRDALSATGRVEVMMTRDGDVFVPLDERVRLARQAGAELFISVHGDSMSNPSGRGATIYTGAERATDLDSAKLAERENAADAEGAGAGAFLGTGISDILQELTVRETRGLSHRFAGDLQSGLSGVIHFTPQPHREAGFRVLRAHDMTSVLVELGYLSNARDAHLLSSEDWRLRTAEAMARTVERFLDPRPGARAAVSP